MVTRKKTGTVLNRTLAGKRKKNDVIAPKAGSRISQEEDFTTVLVEEFRAHWGAINTKIRRGVDVAQKSVVAFYFTHRREGLRIARRYYAPARAAMLANATSDEILRLSEPWLGPVRDALEEWQFAGEPRRLLRTLVAAEYVALTWREDGSREFPPDGTCIVHPLVAWRTPFHDQELYAQYYRHDLFEMATPWNGGAKVRVCKSAAEPFLKTERREAAIELEQEIRQGAREDAWGDPDADKEWRINFVNPTDPRAIDIEIWEDSDREGKRRQPQHK